jgi:hypothetical protein
MKPVLLALLLIAVCAVLPADAVAQGCSMCSKTAGQLGEKAARGLNAGILYLAAIPLVAIGTIGTIWWRRARHDDGSLDH